MFNPIMCKSPDVPLQDELYRDIVYDYKVEIHKTENRSIHH